MEIHIPDICASFEAAVVEVLVTKTIRAAKQHNIQTIALGGGVSANTSLRTQLEQSCLESTIDLFTPQIKYCTDNAAMIGLAGYYTFLKTGMTSIDRDVYSRSHLG